jgi:DHA2 family multidrug resistance protein-like MFS transporter
MLSVVSWQWLFGINIPLGLLALWFGWRYLPPNRAVKKPYDVRSAVLNAFTFGLFSLGINGISHGQSTGLVVLELALAAGIGTFFVRRQLTQEAPLLPVDLLRKPILALSFTTSLCSFIGQMLLLITLPFYLQQTIGLSPGQTGLVMSAWPLTVALMAPLAGYLADRNPAGLLGCIGLILAAIGIVALGLLSPHSATGDIIWRMALCGFGFGLFQTPNTRIIVQSSPRERSGSVGGMIGTVRLTGQTIGAALAALMFNIFPDQSGKIISIYGAVGIVLVAAAVSVARLPLAKKATD